MALAGLTGLAVSQPLLNIAAENPSLFTFAGVSGWELVVFALGVALGPPLVIWAIVLIVGKVQDRAGDAVFMAAAAALITTAALQWVKAAGIERRWAVALIAVAGAAAITVALVRWAAVATFARYSAVLPVISLLLLVLSPTGDLLSVKTQTTVSSQTDPDVAPVVFVMLDEFPTLSLLDEEDTVDPVRFPNLAAFADDATWYRDYTTMAAFTLQAVPSILSGQKPTASAPLWTEHPDTLFSMLAPSHELEVSETVSQLCGFSDCGLVGAETERGGLRAVSREMADVWRQRVSLDPAAAADMGQFSEEAVPLSDAMVPTDDESLGSTTVSRRPQRVTDFLDSLARPFDRPSLHYLHVLLPHYPFVRYPDGTRYTGADTEGLSVTGRDINWSRVTAEQRHLLQAEYADRLVGEIIDTLRATGDYDRSLVVITADHGVSFKTPALTSRLPAPDSVTGIAYVPLFIKAPDQVDGRVDDANLMAPDLLPTMADLLGVQPPGPVDGVPATDRRIAERGDRKQIDRFWSTPPLVGPMRNQGTLNFDAASRPRATDRWVGPIDDDDPVLGGLFAPLGVEQYLGVDPASLDPSPGGTVEVADLDAVRTPDADQPSGVLRGRIIGSPSTSEGTILMGIGDRIVSAAPVSTDGSFDALLPPPDPDRGRGPLTLLQVDDGELTDLQVEPLQP